MESTPLVLLDFEHKMSICLFQERILSMKIHKFLTLVCNFSLQLLSLISCLCSSCFQVELNMINSVLVSFIESLLLLNHLTKCFNSLLVFSLKKVLAFYSKI